MIDADAGIAYCRPIHHLSDGQWVTLNIGLPVEFLSRNTNQITILTAQTYFHNNRN